MGMRTEARIAAWQERAGIQEATGERRELLDAISKAAFELIKLVELARSGIRDGDGCWHGSDPIDGLVEDIDRLWRRYCETWNDERVPATPDKAADDFFGGWR
jgi:hypothetical protein